MKKDVIYIDTEDDITSIIEKVKVADAKIVALVPPKRVGVLQSAVNLKLLQKAAGSADKKVVLITNDHSLTALAAGVRIPVAKNLQSPPEVAPIAALEVDEEDVINGEEMPVGEIASTVGAGALASTPAGDLDKAVDALPPKPTTPLARPGVSSKAAGKKGLSIPNFESFRKRLFIFGGAGVVLLLFLIWAIAFAPKATITINAKTSSVDINRSLALDPARATSDTASLTLKPNVQQLKKTATVEFDATGKKEIGNKATGSITIRNCDYADGFTLSSGAQFTSAGGQVFVSTQSVSVPKFTGPASSCTLSGNSSGKATVAVAAVNVGPEYNIAAQSYSMGAIEGEVDAVGTAMSGGSKETVTVVSDEDVNKAKQQLAQQDVEAAKSELLKQFTGEYVIIAESYVASQGQPTVSPAVGEQAKRSKVTLETTFLQTALARADVKAMLDAYMKQELDGKDNQSVYSNGENNLRFSQFQTLADGKSTVKLSTTAFVGPKINTDELAKQLQGKRYGEIEQIVESLPGVNKVDIKFSPFWVNSAPAANKIDIKFSVVNDGR